MAADLLVLLAELDHLLRLMKRLITSTTLRSSGATSSRSGRPVEGWNSESSKSFESKKFSASPPMGLPRMGPTSPALRPALISLALHSHPPESQDVCSGRKWPVFWAWEGGQRRDRHLSAAG